MQKGDFISKKGSCIQQISDLKLPLLVTHPKNLNFPPSFFGQHCNS